MTVLTIEAYRHPPIANPQKLCYGRYDISLEHDWQRRLRSSGLVPDPAPHSQGEEQNHVPPRIYVSPAQRTRIFAQWLFPHSISCVEPRLQEMDFGAWEGRSWQEICHDEVRHWEQDLWLHGPPEGESAALMAQRIAAFLDSLYSLSQGHPRPRVVCITHHGVLKLMVARALQLSITETIALTIPFGGKLSFRLQAEQLELLTQLPYQ